MQGFHASRACIRCLEASPISPSVTSCLSSIARPATFKDSIDLVKHSKYCSLCLAHRDFHSHYTSELQKIAAWPDPSDSQALHANYDISRELFKSTTQEVAKPPKPRLLACLADGASLLAAARLPPSWPPHLQLHRL